LLLLLLLPLLLLPLLLLLLLEGAVLLLLPLLRLCDLAAGADCLEEAGDDFCTEDCDLDAEDWVL
jgi:hypothetical protein